MRKKVEHRWTKVIGSMLLGAALVVTGIGVVNQPDMGKVFDRAMETVVMESEDNGSLNFMNSAARHGDGYMYVLGTNNVEAVGKPEVKGKVQRVDLVGACQGDDHFDIVKEEDVAALINQERAKVGLAPLVWDDTLEVAAEIRAREQKELFSHTRPDGTDYYTAFDEAGVKCHWDGENVAAGKACSAAAMMNAMMNSAAHRSNILCADFKRVGVGYFESNGIGYWAQEFAD